MTDVAVEEEARIVVEDGGILHLDNANFESEESTSTLLIYDGTEIGIDEDIDDSSATMTIYFSIDVPESAHLNLTIDDITTSDITGESESFVVDLGQPVNVTVDHYYPLQIGITHIELFTQTLS